MKRFDIDKEININHMYRIPEVKHFEPQYKPLSKLKISSGKVYTGKSPLDFVVPWQIENKQPKKHWQEAYREL